MIDTVFLAGNTYDSVTGQQLVQPVGPTDAKLAMDQLRWIDSTLSASTADYIIVGTVS